MVVLTKANGTTYLSRFDQDGLQWEKFLVDPLSIHGSRRCCICGSRTGMGWLCVDRGEAVCVGCVTFTDAE